MTSTKKYIRDIRKHLLLPRREQKKILISISQMLDDYIEEYPQATYDDLIRQFGSPKDMADGVMKYSFKSFSTTAQKQKKLLFFSGIIIAVSFVILCISCFIISKLKDIQFIYVTETIVVDEVVEDGVVYNLKDIPLPNSYSDEK